MKPSYPAIARDGLLLLPRLMSASARVGWEQYRGKPPANLQRFTSIAWLAEHLEIDPKLIEGASIEEVHHGTASRSRLHIRYGSHPGEAPGPRSFFVKSTPPNFAAGLFGVLFDLGGTEVSFYRQIRRGLPVKAPDIFYCEGTSTSYVMLLEDLTDRGCTFRDLAEKCTLEEATAIITTLGTLHAAFWESERFQQDLAWVNRFETNRDFRLLSLVRQLSVPIAFEKFGDVLPAKIREIVPHLMDNYYQLEKRWAEGPRTLLHGDAHLGNIYFQDGEAGLLDWQVTQYGQGMRDISYLLINSVREELRLAHQEELIRHYLATLKAHGVSLDFDTAWRQYRLQSVYAWIAGIVTAPSNFQEEKVVISGLRRACNAILDLDAIELIREL